MKRLTDGENRCLARLSERWQLSFHTDQVPRYRRKTTDVLQSICNRSS